MVCGLQEVEENAAKPESPLASHDPHPAACTPPPAIRLVVGLGNPGLDYQSTPHNLGFLTLDRLAEQAGIRVRRKECLALVGQGVVEGRPVVLAKPQSRASESIVEMAYALSGVRAKSAPKSREPQKSGLFGRLLGNVNEQAEVRVE